MIGDYSKAKKKVGWEPKTKFEEVINLMVDEDVRRLKEHPEVRAKLVGCPVGLNDRVERLGWCALLFFHCFFFTCSHSSATVKLSGIFTIASRTSFVTLRRAHLSSLGHAHCSEQRSRTQLTGASEPSMGRTTPTIVIFSGPSCAGNRQRWLACFPARQRI